jgi:hypothetical protein
MADAALRGFGKEQQEVLGSPHSEFDGGDATPCDSGGAEHDAHPWSPLGGAPANGSYAAEEVGSLWRGGARLLWCVSGGCRCACMADTQAAHTGALQRRSRQAAITAVCCV